jgi:hypothetical protein
MEKATPPKKPMTAFFMWKAKQAEKGNKLGGKDAGKAWKELSDGERGVYEKEYKDAKAVYEKYLEEVEGIAPKSSSKKKEKPTCYNPTRIRAVCGKNKDIKELAGNACRALGRVVEKFMQDLGKSCSNEMKANDKKTVTVDVLVSAVDSSEKFSFLKGMENYDKMIKEAEDAAEAEKEKAKKQREKTKKSKEEEGEASEDEDKKKKSKKAKSKTKC